MARVRDRHERFVHPLYQHARDALNVLFDDLRAAGQLPVTTDEALGRFVGSYMTLTAKLAGATGGLARDHISDRGFVIARLKRILEIHNETLTAADALGGNPFLSPQRLAHHRAALFSLREAILTLIARLRE